MERENRKDARAACVQGGADAVPLALAVSAPAKLKGLLATRAHDGMLLLAPCNDVHTAGMVKPVDIAFVDSSGAVIEAHRAVAPLNRRRCRGAVAVIERFSTCDTPWFAPGDRVGVSRIKGVGA